MLRKYGSARQLTGAITLCGISLFLLLPAFLWYNLRFSPSQAVISSAEVGVALAYIALWGWLLPLSVTVTYYLFTVPRALTKAVQVPRSLPGIIAPFAFREDIPWGWLEYRSGRLQGQRLELKRVVITLGRGEDNDIWIDDNSASRYHIELAWQNGNVYITDCDSLNGTLLNGKRVRGTLLVKPGAVVEVGDQRFVFEQAQQPEVLLEQDDPLLRHVWHSASSLTSTKLPTTQSFETDANKTAMAVDTGVAQTRQNGITSASQQNTADSGQVVPQTQPPVAIEGLLLKLPSKMKQP